MNDTDQAQDQTEQTGSGLRAELERRVAESKEKDAAIAELRTRLMGKAFSDLGLDPERGIGKAAAMTFDGEPEHLAEYVAEQFDYLGPGNPLAPQITQAQSRLDEVGNVAIPVQPISTNERLARAEAEGDFATSGAIKAAQMVKLMRRNG